VTSSVTLLPGRQVIAVTESESILDAALRAGINLPHSCKGGHCASCRARILSGAIRYPSDLPPGLTPQEQAEGFALLCQARPASAELTIEVRQTPTPVADTQVRSIPCRIEHMAPLAPDVMEVRLRLPQSEVFTFVAGQYIDIMLPGSRRRSFSLANPPHDAAQLELHVRRVRGGEFTQQLFESMKEKTLLRIEGPLGQFAFREDSVRPALLVGGGTGYAPLRAMLRSLLERGDTRQLHLYWGAATQADLYAEPEIRQWLAQYPTLQYTPVLSAPPADWSGRSGFVHAAVLADHPRLADFDVYAAGPPAMIEAIRHEFVAAGLPRDQLFFDSFDYAPDALAKLKAAGVAP
jgi:CDP-4-dehydro-6-deoxyglucose reductase